MINKPGKVKIEARCALAADVDAFLANGGEITELPGFGCRAGLDATRIKFTYQISGGDGRVISKSLKQLPDELLPAIDRALIAGEVMSVISRQYEVGRSLIIRRRDFLLSRGKMKLTEVQI